MITNIPAEMLVEKLENLDSRLLRLRLVRAPIVDTPELRRLDIKYRKTYEEAEKGEALCYTGSLGFLEIAVREGSASEWAKANVSDGIILTVISET
jgi:S-adenosylmethionine hydrolase